MDFQGRTPLALATENGHRNSSLLLKVTVNIYQVLQYMIFPIMKHLFAVNQTMYKGKERDGNIVQVRPTNNTFAHKMA